MPHSVRPSQRTAVHLAPLAWVRRADALRVPSVRFARVWLIGRRKRERLRRINRACADSGQGARQSGCERERARTAGCARRRRNGGGWRREVFRPSQTPRCGGWIAQTRTDESRGPRAERRREPQDADVPTVADNAPAQPSGLCEEGRRREQDAPERNLLIVERRGWPRRCPYPQGKARLARYPPHADRQHTSAAHTPHTSKRTARRLGGTPRPTVGHR